MEVDSEDELEEIHSNHGTSSGLGTEEDTQEDAMEVQYGCGESGGAHCLAFPSSNGTIVCVSYEDLQKCTRMIQSTVAAIPQNGNEVIIKLGNGAAECLQLVSDLWGLNPGREALQRVATNAARRLGDFLECLYTNVTEGQGRVFHPNNLLLPLCGVPTGNRQDDNRVVLCNRSPPANSSQSNPAPDNSPQPILSQPNAAPANTAPANPVPHNPPLPNLPPPNSTLDTVMAATMQVLDYVWKYKWWFIGGAAVGAAAVATGLVVAGGAAAGAVVVGSGGAAAGGTVVGGGGAAAGVAVVGGGAAAGVAVVGGGGAAAGGAVVGGGTVAASVAAKVVGGGVVGAVAGLAAKKVKDKCTQPPPHEHQD